MPRIGGLAVWAGFLPAAVIAPPSVPGRWPIWMAAWGMIAVVSLFDDWRGVHPIHRLGAHLVAASLVAASLVSATTGPDLGIPGWLAGVMLAIVLVWSANLYNFMDGSDGLAGAMGVCGFGAYGIAASMTGNPAATYYALAAATLAFLAVNVPPARTFMGDVGAVPMGFLAAAFGLAGWQTGAWPGWFPILVFLPFLADATLTLMKRILRRERIWEAHKGHYYQRVHQLGAGHAGTLALFGAVMLGTTVSAIVTLAEWPEGGWDILAIWSIVIGALFLGIDYHWRHHATLPR